MADDNPYTIRTPSAAKQFGIAVFFGALAAFLTWKIAHSLASPDTAVGSVQTQGAYKFVFYMAAFAGGLGYIIASKLYKWWADKQYVESLGPPQAIARDRKDEKNAAPAVVTEPTVAAARSVVASDSSVDAMSASDSSVDAMSASDSSVDAMSATERALAKEDPLAQTDISTDRKRELE